MTAVKAGLCQGGWFNFGEGILLRGGGHVTQLHRPQLLELARHLRPSCPGAMRRPSVGHSYLAVLLHHGTGLTALIVLQIPFV